MIGILARAYKWAKHKLVEPREPMLVEPEPASTDNPESPEGFNQLKQSFDSLLESLRSQEAIIEDDIIFLEHKAGLTMPDRRHLKHLHEELHSIRMDIVAVEMNKDKTFK